MRKLPSVWSVVWTDNACYVMTTFAPVLFVLALLVKLTGTLPGGRGKPDRPVDPEFASFMLAGATALTIFLGGIVAARVARIRSLFDAGEEVEATVKKVSRFRGGSTLKLEYVRAGTTYKVRSSFQSSTRIPAFTAGDRVSLLVDRMNPKRAVPTALYANVDAPAPSRDGQVAVQDPGSSPWPTKAFGLQLSSGTSQPARKGDER